MKIEKVVKGIRYTLSNENLEVNDKVFSIANGRCLEDGGWILHGFDFRDFVSGFPSEPHTILDLKHSSYKPYTVRTNYGYGPIETYYKIIKEEQQVRVEGIFPTRKWVEV